MPVAKVGIQVDANVGAAVKQLRGLSGQVQGMRKTFGTAAKSVASFGAAFIGIQGIRAGLSFLSSAAREAREFDNAMRNIGTLDSAIDMSALKAQFVKLPAIFGTVEETAAAAYQAISAGVAEKSVTAFITDAAKFAKAGLTTTERAVDVLTSVINSYGLEAKNASQISDVLFSVIKQGKTTADQLAVALPRAIPAAKLLGVSIEDVGAAFAVLTKNGISTNETATKLQQLFSQLAKPTTTLSALLSRLGYDTATAALASEGLGGFLEILNNEAGGSAEKMRKLFKSTEAMSAAAVLTKGNVKDFAGALRNVKTAAGATKVAFDTQIDDLAEFGATWKDTFENIGAVMQNFKENMAKDLLPIFKKVAASVQNWRLRADLKEEVLRLGKQFRVTKGNVALVTDAIKRLNAETSVSQSGNNVRLVDTEKIEQLKILLAAYKEFLADASNSVAGGAGTGGDTSRDESAKNALLNQQRAELEGILGIGRELLSSEQQRLMELEQQLLLVNEFQSSNQTDAETSEVVLGVRTQITEAIVQAKEALRETTESYKAEVEYSRQVAAALAVGKRAHIAMLDPVARIHFLAKEQIGIFDQLISQARARSDIENVTALKLAKQNYVAKTQLDLGKQQDRFTRKRVTSERKSVGARARRIRDIITTTAAELNYVRTLTAAEQQILKNARTSQSATQGRINDIERELKYFEKRKALQERSGAAAVYEEHWAGAEKKLVAEKAKLLLQLDAEEAKIQALTDLRERRTQDSVTTDVPAVVGAPVMREGEAQKIRVEVEGTKIEPYISFYRIESDIKILKKTLNDPTIPRKVQVDVVWGGMQLFLKNTATLKQKMMEVAEITWLAMNELTNSIKFAMDKVAADLGAAKLSLKIPIRLADDGSLAKIVKYLEAVATALEAENIADLKAAADKIKNFNVGGTAFTGDGTFAGGIVPGQGAFGAYYRLGDKNRPEAVVPLDRYDQLLRGKNENTAGGTTTYNRQVTVKMEGAFIGTEEQVVREIFKVKERLDFQGGI